MKNIEIGKNYYYVGVGYKKLLNKIVKVISLEEDKFGSNKDISVYNVEDENLNTYRVMELSLDKKPWLGQINRAEDLRLLPDNVRTFPTFKNGRYVGDM